MVKKLSRREFLLASGTGVAALGLAACAPPAAAPAPAAPKAEEAESAAAEPTAAPAAPDVVKIVWGTPWGGEPPFIQKNMELFHAAYKNIQCEYLPITDFDAKMKTMTAAHSLPDVYYLDSMMGPEWAALGTCLALDDFFKTDLNMDLLTEDFLPLSGEFQGRHWMLCNAQGPMGFYYNMDAFDEVGLEYPNEDWTWDDMLSAALKLTKRNGDVVERFGLAVTRDSSFVYQNGGTYLDADRRKVLLGQPEAVAGLQWVSDLYTKHKVAPLPGDLQLQPTTFQNGRIAMSWGDGPWSIGSGGYRDAPFRWDVTFVPAGKKEGVINYGSGMAVYSESKHPQEAWTYAKFWLEHECQLNFHGTWESMPITKKALEEQFVGPNRKQKPEHYPIFAEEIDGPKKISIVEPYIPGFYSWVSPWSNSRLYNEVMTVANTGEGTVEELIQPLVQEWQAYIDENSKNW